MGRMNRRSFDTGVALMKRASTDRTAESRVIKAARKIASAFMPSKNFPVKGGSIYELVKAVEALDRRKK